MCPRVTLFKGRKCSSWSSLVTHEVQNPYLFPGPESSSYESAIFSARETKLRRRRRLCRGRR